VNGLPVIQGVVRNFDLQTGNGIIATDTGEDVFFNFTAIPGEGYRTIQPATLVSFEVFTSNAGLNARNIQPQI